MPRWWGMWLNTHFRKQSPFVIVKSACPPAFIVHVSAITASGVPFSADKETDAFASKCLRSAATSFFVGGGSASAPGGAMSSSGC